MQISTSEVPNFINVFCYEKVLSPLLRTALEDKPYPLSHTDNHILYYLPCLEALSYTHILKETHVVLA